MVVDVTPGFLLVGAIALADIWEQRRRRIALFVGGVTVVYFAVFSFPLVRGYEGEKHEFFSQLNSLVKSNDILVVSSVSQQVIVPMRATFGKNVLGVADDTTPMTLIESEFAPLARKSGGRLLYLGSTGEESEKLRSITSLDFIDRFFSNTDHFRNDPYAYLSARSRLVLPYKWLRSVTSWELYEVVTG